MKLEEVVDLKINGTKLIIGSVQDIFLPEEIIQEDGFANVSSRELIGVTGLDCYAELSYLERLSYAKPNKTINTIEIK